MTSIAALAPLLFGLHSGVFADRRSYTFVTRSSLAIRIVVCLLCSLLLFLGKFSIGIAAVTLFALNAMSLYFESAAWAVVPRIALNEERVGLNAHHEAILLATAMIAPWLSAVAVNGNKPGFFLVGCACTMAGCLCFVRTGEEGALSRADGGLRAGILDGVKYIFRDPVQKCISWSAMLFNFSHAAFFAVFTFYALKVLGISVAAVAAIFFVTALGGMVAAFLTPYVIAKLGTYRAAMWSMIVLLPAGLPLVAASFASSYAPFLITVTFVAWEVAILVNVITETTLRQERTPTHILGSVASASRFINWGADPLGAGLAALLLLAFEPLSVLALAFLGMVFAFLPLVIGRGHARKAAWRHDPQTSSA